jgi:RNase P protein component
MPTIALPPTAGGDNTAPDDAARLRRATTEPSLRVRMRAVAHRSALTAELATGADPGSSPELALRAAQLTSKRERNLLARTVRRTIAEARKPAILPHNVVIIRRRAVLDAEPALQALIERLGRPEPVSAKGMALAERIFSDAEHSPLYNPAESGALSRLARLAAAALEPNEGHHEFPLGA